MCKRFEDGLNEDICLYVGVLELKEFVVLVDRTCKAEELAKEKRKVEIDFRDSRKRQLSKSYQSSFKKSRDFSTRPVTLVGVSNQSKGKQFSGFKAQTTSVASVGNVRLSRPECPQCGRHHSGECRANEKDCFRCGSLDHFIRDCLEVDKKEKSQSAKPGKQTARVEGRAPARTYAIRAREEASSPDVITGTFSLYDTRVIALIDPRSTHSYICMNLVSSMSTPIESTKFIIRVPNPLGKYVLVDRVCKGCLLMIRSHCFPVDLMLLPFDEFNVILEMDWLVTHGVVVNCGKQFIELKNENGDFIRVESNKQDRSPVVISSLLTQKYLRKGYKAYLAIVMNAKETELRIESVPIVCEHPDVFLEELPGLPPVREIKFLTELALGTAPISIAPYRIAPTELKELKE
ncbi:Gag-Pol polyprotein [Gossypium australe]|uniref:Gag-Pol polyprotein n=1 Tax=Gossypium australe TaxID=47621 RepID=A0A5B6VNJ1_9ROSI|nr:Gag-Pol polyprotein [Gossypium australe]